MAVLLAGVTTPLQAEGDRAVETQQASTRWPTGAVTRIATMPERVWGGLYNGLNWSMPRQALLFTTAEGDLGIAAVDSDRRRVMINRHDPVTLKRKGQTVTLSYRPWTIFGGIFATDAGELYVLAGRYNREERDDLNVIGVRRYRADFTFAGQAVIRGDATQYWKGITVPFDASAADALLVGDRFVVHSGRELYRLDDGINHQMNFSFEVDTTTMTARTFDEIAGSNYGGHSYVGHSFRQLLALDGESLVMADHGDAYPRAIAVGVMRGYPTSRSVEQYEVFPINGETGDNQTGTSLTDMESAGDGVVIVGNSIRHPDTGVFSPSDSRNAFAIMFDADTGAHNTKWLSSFAAKKGATAGEPSLIPIGDDRLVVIFARNRARDDKPLGIEYRLLDGDGNELARRTLLGVSLQPQAAPRLVGDRILWPHTVQGRYEWPKYIQPKSYLFGIDISDPSSPRIARRG